MSPRPGPASFPDEYAELAWADVPFEDGPAELFIEGSHPHPCAEIGARNTKREAGTRGGIDQGCTDAVSACAFLNPYCGDLVEQI